MGRLSMSSPDDSERSDRAPNLDYAPKWAGDYRQGRARGAEGGLSKEGEGSSSIKDQLQRRRSLDPEIVHFRQPPPPRRGRFASNASFAIAAALGIVIGLAVTGQFPSILGEVPSLFGETPRSSTKMNELASRLDHSKNPTAQQPAEPAQVATVGGTNEPARNIRGVTDAEIRFGISAPFTGSARDLGQNMKTGIEAAFNAANVNGGVYGRRLRLIAMDDGYEPARTAMTMKELYEKDEVFGLLGNVGTPTAVVALPYALDRKMLFFGAFTGAGLLRNDPPDRYVFNYRASYAEETDAVVNYLVKVRQLVPEQIAVFGQQDAYGDAGFAGVQKAIRALRGGNETPILRLNYQRNTVDVDDAVAQLQLKRHIPIKAVIMVPTYRAAAKFIEKTRNLYPDMIYTSVSFVGGTALADELMLLGPKYATGVIV